MPIYLNHAFMLVQSTLRSSLIVAQASWMDSQESLEMSNYKDSKSDFAVEVSRIKYNAIRAMLELSKVIAAKAKKP